MTPWSAEYHDEILQWPFPRASSEEENHCENTQEATELVKFTTLIEGGIRFSSKKVRVYC